MDRETAMTMDHRSRTQLRAAVFRALPRVPGPAGELARPGAVELDQFGHRLGGNRIS